MATFTVARETGWRIKSKATVSNDINRKSFELRLKNNEKKDVQDNNNNILSVAQLHFQISYVKKNIQ